MLEKVSISLSDCLACSGCITSAESVLVSQQGPDELLRILTKCKEAKVTSVFIAFRFDFDFNHKLFLKEINDMLTKEICIITLAVQPVLSLAHKYELDPQSAAEHVAGFFLELGADIVTMSTIGEDLSLLESYKEFLAAFKSNPSSLPLLTGICPGKRLNSVFIQIKLVYGINFNRLGLLR